MRTLSLLAMLALATTAGAQNHGTVTGSGGSIPASGTGGGGSFPGTLPPTPGSSDVAVPDDVTSVTSIEVAGLSHTWIGDLQLVLCDPNGVGHLIFLRPGYLNPSGAGNSGDFLGGDYVFVESGGMDLPTTSNTGVNPPPGTYNQTFDSGGTVWPDGTANIFNTPMSAIAGPAGTWTLKFYDWAGGDVGGFVSWTLNYRFSGGPGTPVCFGDGSGSPCGCGNELPGTAGGCLNTAGTTGVMTVTGTADTTAPNLTFCTTGQTPNQPGLLFQGNNTIGGGNGVTFGDGIRCCGQNVVRMTIRNGDGCTDVTSIAGLGIQPGDKKCYQKWYRDPTGVCQAGSFNFTNAVSIIWN